MEQEDFVSLLPLKIAVVNRKVSTYGTKVPWLKLQWISVSKDKPLRFQYRYSINSLESWKTVNLKRKTKGHPPDMGRITLPSLFTAPRAIKKEKLSAIHEVTIAKGTRDKEMLKIDTKIRT